MIAFLILFGVISALTPSVIISDIRTIINMDMHQRSLLRNMLVCGVSLVFVAVSVYFIG